jgi:prepilin-type N-terminal cleavage/methylation domain-containing protein
MRAAGFTLVELLVSLAALGVVLAGAFGVLRETQSAYVLGVARLEAQQSARIALERMAREIQGAGFDPGGVRFPAIVNATPTSLTIQKDLNGNGVIGGSGESVTYFLRDTTLRRNSGAGAQPVIEGVQSLAFTYFDGDGLPATTPDRIRGVRIALAVRPTALWRSPVAGSLVVSLHTEVRLRNR